MGYEVSCMQRVEGPMGSNRVCKSGGEVTPGGGLGIVQGLWAVFYSVGLRQTTASLGVLLLRRLGCCYAAVMQPRRQDLPH